MPDHIHLLFRLGERLTLGQTIARLKSKTKQAVSLHRPAWQSGYYDHKLHHDEDLHPILHYIYLNPYRSNLIASEETWPYTEINSKDWTWFEPLLNNNCPYPEWLTEPFATKVAPTS